MVLRRKRSVRVSVQRPPAQLCTPRGAPLSPRNALSRAPLSPSPAVAGPIGNLLSGGKGGLIGGCCAALPLANGGICRLRPRGPIRGSPARAPCFPSCARLGAARGNRGDGEPSNQATSQANNRANQEVSPVQSLRRARRRPRLARAPAARGLVLSRPAGRSCRSSLPPAVPPCSRARPLARARVRS